MTFKSIVAIQVGKLTRLLLRLFKRNGGSYPGQITLKIDPNALQTLAKDYDVVIITGTNGKTLTTALTVQALKQHYNNILTNDTGSNMTQGVVSAFLGHKIKKGDKKIAVLEIDEAYVKVMSQALSPKYIVTTNIFRDQMDRFGEIYTTYQKILDGITASPNTTVIANGDAPIFNSATVTNPKIYFGFDHQEKGDFQAHYNTDGIICPHCEKIIRYRSIVYANLGHYYCPNCHFQRPQLTHAVTAISQLTLDHSSFAIDNVPFELPVAGLYNIYNALAAYTVAKQFNVNTPAIQRAFAQMPRVFGRQERIVVDGKEVLINLIKNPVGLNQVIDLLTLQPEECCLLVALNDNYADGQDISWIWDGQFEQLHHLPLTAIAVSGSRSNDMALRLQVAGFQKETLQNISIDSVLTYIQQSNCSRVYILATYTAMLDIRKTLAAKGYVKGELQA